MKKIILLLIFINFYISVSADYYFNSSYKILKNYNKNLIDSNYLHFSDIGCGFLGLKNNAIDIVFREVNNDSLNYRKFSMQFLNSLDSLVGINVNENFNQTIQIENLDTIIHNENYTGGENFSYNELYSNMNLEVKFNSNKINYLIRTVGLINQYKFKLRGLDSIRYNLQIDSNLNCFINNKKFILPKFYAIQIDTLNDTTFFNSQYTVNNDTISLNIPNLDSLKYTQIFTQDYNGVTSNYSSYLIESENYELNDSITYTFKNEQCELIFYTKEYFLNDYLRSLNFNQNYKFPTLKKRNLNYKYTKNDYLVYDRIFNKFDNNDTINIIKVKYDWKGDLIVLFKTNNELGGSFNSTLDDSVNFNYQPNAYHNNVLTKISNNGDIHSSYYINFYDSLFYNNKLNLSDFIIKDYDIYFIGSCIFNYYDTLYSLNQFDKYNQNSIQKGVIFKFNTYYNMLFNNLFLGHSLINEYLHFNCINLDENEKKGLLTIGGITNSKSILDSNLWNKSTNNSDNIIISINTSLDSIYKVVKIGGSGEEINGNQYFEFKNYLFKNYDKFYFFGETNSSEFETDSLISNIRQYNNYSTFVCNLDENLDLKKVLFLESNLNNSINDVAFSFNKIAVSMQTKSNIFQMADSLQINSIDSVSTNTTYDKTFTTIFDEELLSFYNGNYIYKPIWTSYIESINSNLNTNNLFFDEEYLKVYINTKSNNIILTNNYNLNNNFNNFYNDGCILKVNFLSFY